MPSGDASNGGRVNALRSRLKRREGSVHYPRAPTLKTEQHRKGTDPRTGRCSQNERSYCPGVRFVLCSGWLRWFLFLWCPSPVVRFVALLWHLILDVSSRGPDVVKKFEEQAGADSITLPSSGTPRDAMADMVWGYFYH